MEIRTYFSLIYIYDKEPERFLHVLKSSKNEHALDHSDFIDYLTVLAKDNRKEEHYIYCNLMNRKIDFDGITEVNRQNNAIERLISSYGINNIGELAYWFEERFQTIALKRGMGEITIKRILSYLVSVLDEIVIPQTIDEIEEEVLDEIDKADTKEFETITEEIEEQPKIKCNCKDCDCCNSEEVQQEKKKDNFIKKFLNKFRKK